MSKTLKNRAVARLVEDLPGYEPEPDGDLADYLEDTRFPGYRKVFSGLPPQVYIAFDRLLESSRHKTFYKFPSIAETTLRKDFTGDISFYYHYSELIRALPDDTVLLYTRGYATLTTCRRINMWFRELGGWKVYIKDGQVFIKNVIFNYPGVKFEDGMIITPEGDLLKKD